MTSGLAQLRAILPPPEDPIETNGAQTLVLIGGPLTRLESWDAVEQALGTNLPADYKGFIDTYGSGLIDEFIRVLNPFSQMSGLSLVESAREMPHFWEDCASFFPADGGLLPVATTTNGDLITWKTRGAPDDWTIMVLQPRSDKTQRFAASFTTFLGSLLGRAKRCRLFPEDFPSASPIFRPWTRLRESNNLQLVFAEEEPFETRTSRIRAVLASTGRLSVRHGPHAFWVIRPGGAQRDAIDISYDEDTFYSDIEQRTLHRGTLRLTFARIDEEIAKEHAATCIRILRARRRRLYEVEVWPDLEDSISQ